MAKTKLFGHLRAHSIQDLQGEEMRLMQHLLRSMNLKTLE